MNLLIRFIVNAVVLYLIAKFVPGFDHNMGAGGAIVSAIIFGIVNAVLGPILRLLSAPITWLTHGLFSFVINYILFAIVVALPWGIRHNGEINGWLANLYGTIIMMIVATVIAQMSKSESERTASAA